MRASPLGVLASGGVPLGTVRFAAAAALGVALAGAAGAVVASIDYRMAPEHRFPAAVDDTLAGVRWLAAHLNDRWRSGEGALVTVSHDRWFLDAVCGRMWEVHDRTVDAFEGGYAAYVLQRVERDRQARETEARRQNLLRKELAWLRRGAPARTSKPKFRIEAAESLIADVPEPRSGVELRALAQRRLGRQVVDVEDVSPSGASGFDVS